MAESKPARPLVGDVIGGRYRIDSVAGQGGMGIVYEAEHVILRKRVALKVLLPGALPSAEALERFAREAAAIARISCEHVVRVLDAGTLSEGGAPYLVMEYLVGQNLEELLRGRSELPSVEAVDYVLQTLVGLAHAHAARVIHRDLKAANLFLAQVADGRRIIKLLDFGVAMTADAYPDDRVIGSPAYMSPEQLRRETLDVRTDLWSLGIVLYELMSGATPFGGGFADLVQAVLHGSAVPLHERNPAVPPGLSAVVQRCLSRDREDRWATAGDLARALAPYGPDRAQAIVDRVTRALVNAPEVADPRRFATVEKALFALETPVINDITTEPPVDHEEAMAFSQTIPVPAANTMRIVMVDSSEDTLRAQADLLSRAGFEVRTTTDPAAVELMIEQWQPHLVVAEAEVAGEDGIRLCHRLKSQFKATLPVVILSNMPPDDLAAIAKADGADAFLHRSGDGAALVAFIRNICAMTYSPEDVP